MKRLVLVLAVSMFSVFQGASAQVPSNLEAPPDIGLALHVDVPGAGNYDLYEYGFIAELQFRDWVAHPWGYAITIGYGDWSVDKNAKRPGAALYDFSGSLEVIPFGGSLLLKAYTGPEWSVIVDAGIRYMANDSNIKARNRDEGGTRKIDVNIGDAVLFTGAVSADYAVSADLIWSLGVGYRYDISRGSLSTEFGSGRDSIMESFFFETALRLPF
ncbi:MAG TPA: hypothetical protein PKE26_14780 [Kiritimatiellia bacterium]|nr:hypothetical protein [Kiritimatiellia bacterium]HMP00365.1 hypothetical protein [Kiritimatiellia bacterium]